MDVLIPALGPPPRADTLLVSQIAALVPSMQQRAGSLDEASAFPDDEIAAMADAGALMAPFPIGFAGLGLGCSPPGAAALTDVLRLLGRGNLAVGRLYEAHVNAVSLLARYGTADQLAVAAERAHAGQLFGLWVTDAPQGALAATSDGVLHGGKAYCSGAGHVAAALVTVVDPAGATRLALLSTENAVTMPLGVRTQGMRAAVTGRVSFEGCEIVERDWIGHADDYLREPEFSAGAWRTSAVTCGGLEALVEAAMRQLVARGRDRDPHQCARMGRAWIAQETALLWVARAAQAAEADDPHPGTADVVATVNLARIAIEAACLEAITHVERSLGLAAFMVPSAVERIRRDLGTYLRQPAPDEVLTEAAAHIMTTRMR